MRKLPQKSGQVKTGGFWQDNCQETLMKRSRFAEHEIISILKEIERTPPVLRADKPWLVQSKI